RTAPGPAPPCPASRRRPAGTPRGTGRAPRQSPAPWPPPPPPTSDLLSSIRTFPSPFAGATARGLDCVLAAGTGEMSSRIGSSDRTSPLASPAEGGPWRGPAPRRYQDVGAAPRDDRQDPARDHGPALGRGVCAARPAGRAHRPRRTSGLHVGRAGAGRLSGRRGVPSRAACRDGRPPDRRPPRARRRRRSSRGRLPAGLRDDARRGRRHAAGPRRPRARRPPAPALAGAPPPGDRVVLAPGAARPRVHRRTRAPARARRAAGPALLRSDHDLRHLLLAVSRPELRAVAHLPRRPLVRCGRHRIRPRVAVGDLLPGRARAPRPAVAPLGAAGPAGR